MAKKAKVGVPTDQTFLPPEARWYVEERAGLLAKLFVIDLKSTETFGDGGGLDTFVVFNETTGLRVIGVKVHATETEVGENGKFSLPRKWLEHARGSNIPMLLLVANAKTSRLHYAWASDVVVPPFNPFYTSIEVPVKPADKNEILRTIHAIG